VIVQRAAGEEPRFVMTLDDHLEVASQIAAAFGNQSFARPEPWPLVQFVARHHDAGWEDVDADPPQNPETGLPCSLGRTPWPALLAIPAASAEYNERHHPLCGLLVSMHYTGLYRGRFGLVSAHAIADVPAQWRPEVDRMLAHEDARQDRLRRVLQADPEAVMHAYFCLQFFDLLALHFNLNPQGAPAAGSFARVPTSAAASVTIAVAPALPGGFTLSPWPFAGDELTLRCRGAYQRPRGDAEAGEQAFTLRAV